MKEKLEEKKTKKHVGNYEIHSSYSDWSENSTFCLANEKGKDQLLFSKSYGIQKATKLSKWLNKEREYGEKYDLKNEIIKCKDSIKNEHNVYILYDYFPSINLYEILSCKTIMISQFEKLEIAKKLAQVISSLHSKGFIHRNINPRHILISNETQTIILSGTKYLINFKEEGYPFESIGTETYKAPEMESSDLSQQTYNEKVDIYSFGITLLLMFSNTIINENSIVQNIMENDTNFINLPKEIQDLIRGCLKVNPQDRLNSNEIIDEKYYPKDSYILNSQELPNEASDQKTSLIKSQYMSNIKTGKLKNEYSDIEKNTVLIKPSIINEETVKIINNYSKSTNILQTIKKYNESHINAMEKKKNNEELLLTKANENKIRTIYSLESNDIAFLGSGGYGEVYLIEDKITKKKYARKKIKTELLNSEKSIGYIFEEINNLKELKDSSFILTLYDAFLFENKPYLILEYCNGSTLDSYVKGLTGQKKEMDINQIKLIAWNIAEGMWMLHKRYIVHRDLKPENILLTKIKESQGEPPTEGKVGDLGVSKKLDIDNPEFKTTVGTPLYYAPELRKKVNSQSLSVKLTNKVDVFSYGLILYFMIYGDHARKIQKNQEEFFKGNYILPEGRTRQIPKSLLNLMLNCLKIDPEERISFKEIIQDIFFQEVIGLNFLNLKMNSENEYKQMRNTSNSQSYLYKKGKELLWLKIYNQEFCHHKTNRKYIYREINFYSISKAISHTLNLRSVGFIPLKQNTNSNLIGLIFDYCEGGSLLDIYAKRKQLNNTNKNVFNQKEIEKVAKCLIVFIDDLHSRNYYHRSISPKHILVILDNEGMIQDIKVCGFRSSKPGNNLKNTFLLFDESYIYIDPDVINGKSNYSLSSDLWSIGILIYFMAYGMTPKLSLEDIQLIRNSSKSIFPDNIPINPDIERLINFCLKRREIYHIKLLELIKEEVGIINFLYF